MHFFLKILQNFKEFLTFGGTPESAPKVLRKWSNLSPLAKQGKRRKSR